MDTEYIPNKDKENCNHPVCNIDSLHKYVYCTWCGKEFVTNLSENSKHQIDKSSPIKND